MVYDIIKSKFNGGEPLESLDVAKMAIKMALSDRAEERELKQLFAKSNAKACAVDFGGELSGSTKRIMERTLVAAKRERV